MVPDINQPQWKDLILTNTGRNLTSISFKITIERIKQNFKLGYLDLDDAVIQLHDFCARNEGIFTNDLVRIFRSKSA